MLRATSRTDDRRRRLIDLDERRGNARCDAAAVNAAGGIHDVGVSVHERVS
jgi:hypothetical protein